MSLPFPGTPGTESIRRERLRQIEREGYDMAHDRTEHTTGDLVAAAIAYASAAFDQHCDPPRSAREARDAWWPWSVTEFKPSTTSRNLEKAGALIAAALDRVHNVELAELLGVE